MPGNKADRIATALRAVISVICWLGLNASLAAAPIVVGVTADSKLVQIDPTTGAGSLYSTLDGNYNPLGIAWNGTGLYLFGQNNGDLRQITDPTTGTTSQVATPLAGLPATGGFVPTKGDLTYNGGKFFIGSSARADGSFDPSFGSLFSVTDAAGYPASQVDSGTFPKVGRLAFSPGGVFYGLDQFGATLFTLNASLGTVTASTALTGAGLDSSVDTVGGLVFGPSGTLYASVSDTAGHSEWFSINPATGTAVDIGSIGGYDIVGLALLGSPVVTPPGVPEPTSLVLIGTGVLMLAALRRRHVKS